MLRKSPERIERNWRPYTRFARGVSSETGKAGRVDFLPLRWTWFTSELSFVTTGDPGPTTLRKTYNDRLFKPICYVVEAPLYFVAIFMLGMLPLHVVAVVPYRLYKYSQLQQRNTAGRWEARTPDITVPRPAVGAQSDLCENKTKRKRLCICNYFGNMRRLRESALA